MIYGIMLLVFQFLKVHNVKKGQNTKNLVFEGEIIGI
jgi:hypothetical protein